MVPKLRLLFTREGWSAEPDSSNLDDTQRFVTQKVVDLHKLSLQRYRKLTETRAISLQDNWIVLQLLPLLLGKYVQ